MRKHRIGDNRNRRKINGLDHKETCYRFIYGRVKRPMNTVIYMRGILDGNQIIRKEFCKKANRRLEVFNPEYLKEKLQDNSPF